MKTPCAPRLPESHRPLTMRLRSLRTALLLFLLAAGSVPSAMAYCYTVYGNTNQILYRSSRPPVDTSFQFHQTVPLVFPAGSNLVFGMSEDACGEVVYNPANATNRGQATRSRRSDRS